MSDCSALIRLLQSSSDVACTLPSRSIPSLHLTGKRLVLGHRSSSALRVIHGVVYKLVAEENVHLLEGAALGLREEEIVADGGDNVQCEEDIEIAKTDAGQSSG